MSAVWIRQCGRLILAAALTATLTAALAATSVWRVQAAPSALTGTSAVATVSADPYSTWYAQMNRDGICALMTGCQSATGDDGKWVFAVLVDVPGLGLQTVSVPIEVTESVPFQSMSLHLTAGGVIGTVDADVEAVLTPTGAGTSVALTIVKATTSGLAETYVPQFIEQFAPTVSSQLAALDSERSSAGIKVALTVKKGKKATARVRVTAATLSESAPVAAGTVRIMIGPKVVCATALRASQATCSFTKPKKATLVRAVVIGEFDNGYGVWNSATARYRP